MSYKPIVNNILAALYRENNCDMKSTLADMNELKDALEESHFGFISDIEDVIKDNAEKTHICPKCFGDMHVVYDENETVEYQGTPVSERIYGVTCGDCGYSRDTD